METVAIVGVGLIGASFGLALRKSGFGGEIIGVSSESALAAGLARGAISSSAKLADAVAQAQLIYLAQPVERILTTIPELTASLRPGTLVTDAGSTKEEIVKCASLHLPEGSFLGGHPIAGKEQRGPEAAEADLFRDRPYVLTPTSGASRPEFVQILHAIGAQVVEMSAQQHDATLALTSHLPQLLSTALAATLERSSALGVRQIYGPGLLDMTRLALSSPDLWESILASNKSHVAEAIDAFVQVLMELKPTLSEREIAYTFGQASGFARAIRKLPLLQNPAMPLKK